MNYKVFFAFQMDIDDKYGKGFIQNAIQNAIDKLKQEKINVVLTYGFRGTPGTPLLIDEMLKKSEEADMVIVDWSFTSSKIWLNSKKVGLGRFGEVRLLGNDSDKKSPNPNVLLETGYAWAQKGHYRTLAVMNDAFGLPSELPVDFNGFRWPITYTLNESNYESRKEVRKQLSTDLHNAIRASIDKEADYQREKWNPLCLHRDWKSRVINRPFSLTVKGQTVIQKLRNALADPENPQRIVGPKKSGKTRLAYEIYRKNGSNLPHDVTIEKVLYYDLSLAGFASIQEKIVDLALLNQRKVLIIDNCPYNLHEQIFDRFLRDTSVSLLTIGESKDAGSGTFFIDRTYVDDAIVKASSQFGDPSKTNYILQESKGDLGTALAIMDALPTAEQELPINHEERWEQIIGKDLVEKKGLALIEELSLFTHVGYSNHYKYQSELIIELSGFNDWNEYDSMVQSLIEKGIIQVQGDFIMLEVFATELALGRLKRLTTEDIGEYFKKVADRKLSKQLSQRFVELTELQDTHEVINALTAESGLLTKIEFINSDQGAKLLMTLAEIEPEKILGSIESALADKSTEQLVGLVAGRRYLVWALERLVFRSVTFKGAAALLFRLAVAENENIGNNATAQFTQLFQVHLPGTKASLDERKALLNKWVDEASDESKPILVQALNRSLMTHGFNRMGGADVQAGEKLEDYRPENNDEVLNYWNDVIDLLLKLEDDEVIKSRFSSQVYDGHRDAIFGALEKVLQKEQSIDDNLRQVFQRMLNDKRDLPEGFESKINVLIDTYTSDSFEELLRIKVALAPFSAYRDDDGNYVNKAEIEARKFAKSLLEQGNDDWMDSINILLSNEQRQTFSFGNELSKTRSEDLEFVKKVISKLKEVAFEEQNNALIEGYVSSVENKEFIRSVIAEYLSVDEVAYHATRLSRYLEIQVEDLRKLEEVFKINSSYCVGLQFQKLFHLSQESIVEFVSVLKVYKPYGAGVALDLCAPVVQGDIEISDEFRVALTGLLRTENILLGEGIQRFTGLRSYVDILTKLDEDGLDSHLVKFIVKEIIRSCQEIHVQHETQISELLELLLDRYWNDGWPPIGDALLNPGYFGWYNLKQLLKRYKNYRTSELIKWMNQSPLSAPQKVVRFVTMWKSTESGVEWSGLATEMLNNYNENEEFLETLSAELHSYSWTGSLVPLFKERLELVSKLKSHENENVKEFGTREAEHFELAVSNAEKDDQNQSLRYQ